MSKPPDFPDEVKNLEHVQQLVSEIAFRLGYITGHLQRIEDKTDKIASLFKMFVESINEAMEKQKKEKEPK